MKFPTVTPFAWLMLAVFAGFAAIMSASYFGFFKQSCGELVFAYEQRSVYLPASAESAARYKECKR